MNLNDARQIWGGMMDDEHLEEWVEITNKIKDEHDKKFPKGATIVIDQETTVKDLYFP
jgi:hypothetical protein